MTPDTQAARQVQLLVVDTQGRLLLKREASPPHWTLLGSALAHDDDYPAAAIRLLFEEAGASFLARPPPLADPPLAAAAPGLAKCRPAPAHSAGEMRGRDLWPRSSRGEI